MLQSSRRQTHWQYPSTDSPFYCNEDWQCLSQNNFISKIFWKCLRELEWAHIRGIHCMLRTLYLIWNSSAAFWRCNHASRSSASFAMMHNGIARPCHAVNYGFFMLQSVKLTMTFQRHLCREVYLEFHRFLAATRELGKSKRDFQ